MSTYLYECIKCKIEREVVKSYRELAVEERCESCLNPMQHIIVSPQISTRNCQFQAHFNYAFGKEVHSKRQLDDQVRRIRGETGRDIVEIGNDNLQSVKKVRKKYDSHINLGDYQ